MFKKSNTQFIICILIFLMSFYSCSSNKISHQTSHQIIRNNQTFNKDNKQSKEELDTSNLQQYNYSIKPGEALFITQMIFRNKMDKSNFSLKCDGKKYDFAYNKKLIFVYAESYFSKSKKHICRFYNNKIIAQFNIVVMKKIYPFERLNVDKKRVVLSKSDLKKVLAERKVLNRIYKLATSKILFDSPFISPLDSKITSVYGTRRIFNNAKKTQHLGTDFRAAIGTKIPAINRGKVIFAGQLFFTGGTIIINHGLNIFSIYGHLSKLLVKKGDFVKKGQMIALSGMSGRVTGPHLHLGIKINKKYIDSFSLNKATKNFKL